MSNQTNHKKITKFLRFQVQRFTNTLGVIEREHDRLVTQGYRDIRKVFAPLEYVEDIVTLNCDQNCITVEFCFSSVENSPVDGFSMNQIKELIGFLRNKLSFTNLRIEDLEKEIEKQRQNPTNSGQ